MSDLMSPFEERYELIDAILAREGLAFDEGMSDAEREQRDIERQVWVLEQRIGDLTNVELRILLV